MSVQVVMLLAAVAVVVMVARMNSSHFQAELQCLKLFSDEEKVSYLNVKESVLEVYVFPVFPKVQWIFSLSLYIYQYNSISYQEILLAYNTSLFRFRFLFPIKK